MNKLLITLAVGSLTTAAQAQFQVNPQVGLTYQNLTAPAEGFKYKGAAGFQLGADMRFGDRLYFQPGAFLGRNTTIVSNTGDTISYEDGLVRTDLK
ncbi:MAG TPA: hypothetical protein VKG92_10170, partial [Flavobacteriales bacterium]|nr:hypothetical protein [Flavobacteriales bacterium]